MQSLFLTQCVLKLEIDFFLVLKLLVFTVLITKVRTSLELEKSLKVVFNDCAGLFTEKKDLLLSSPVYQNRHQTSAFLFAD